MEVYARIFSLFPEIKGVLDAAENKFKEERIKLNVEKYFSLEDLNTFEEIPERVEALETYKKQLILERSFYKSWHENTIKKINELFDSSQEHERIEFWKSAFPKINKNQDLRMRINTAKYDAVNALVKIYLLINSNQTAIEISPQEILFNDSHLSDEFESLVKVVDSNLELQYVLGVQQRGTSA